MKTAIIGLPQVGKKTLFELLTGISLGESAGRDSKEAHIGVVKIRDPRFDRLVSLYGPKKEVAATIEITLVPRIDKEMIRKGELLKYIEEIETVCHIVRAFESEEVYHVEGSVGPGRDIDAVESELVLADLMLVEKRLERIEKAPQTRKAVPEGEKEALLKLKAHLEAGRPLRLLGLTPEDKKRLAAYRFLSAKPVIIVLNISEGDIRGSAALDSIEARCKAAGMDAMRVSAKIEQELAAFESEEEKAAFLKEIGIDEPAVDKLTRALHRLLGLIFFFTVGKNEVRAWTARRGSHAPEAAGIIHSDMERGFIRAEVMKYEEIEKFGNEAKVKEAGRLLVKGKDYIVEDGDILNIRFTV